MPSLVISQSNGPHTSEAFTRLNTVNKLSWRVLEEDPDGRSITDYVRISRLRDCSEGRPVCILDSQWRTIR
jgi:hypothetical protein